MYDLDGNGEIDIYEMEKIFVSLCSIVEKSELEQIKRNRKMRQSALLDEKIRQEKEELQRELARQKEQDESKYKFQILSENFKNKQRKKQLQNSTSIKPQSTVDS